ncbi:MAG: hypothetical protein QOI47_1500 [Actinomycetota bacterium]|nr:hypothetical protein [Actinomycetota bacterium]
MNVRRRDRRPDTVRDRRVPFFLIAAITSLALYYPAPADFRWVPLTLSIVYVVLAALAALDLWSRARR